MNAEARTCSVDGCSKPMRARGLCPMHYERWRRHESLEPRPAGRPRGSKRLHRSVPPYYLTRQPGHPLATPRSDGWVLEHRYVLYESIGDGPHTCRGCGRLVEWGPELHVDHINGVTLDNRLKNLIPCCFRCNVKRKTPRVCCFCGGDLKTRRSHARFCSPSCRRRAARCEPATREPKACRGCGGPITGRRADADWCSEPCRARWRGRKRAKPGTGRAETESAPACSCTIPLPTQRSDEPWKCETCGAPVEAPFEVAIG